MSWSAKRQATLSQSSAEESYRCVANVVSKSFQLQNLLLRVDWHIQKAILAHCHNVKAIYLANNLVKHQRIKRIEMDIQFVGEKVDGGKFRVSHVPWRF